MTYQSIKMMIDHYYKTIASLTLEKQYLLNHSHMEGSGRIKTIDSQLHFLNLKLKKWQLKV